MMRILRPLWILAALAAFPADAAAQLEFAGIPWGTAQDVARERIRAAGYTFRGVDQDGDLVFGAADSVDLVAMFDSAGLVYVEAGWLRDPDRLPARYRRMADSMIAAVGAPDTATADEGEDVFERVTSWSLDGAALELYYTPRNGGLDSALLLRHAGPGWLAEDIRRGELPEGPRDTPAVGDYHQAFGGFRVLIRVDTARYERVGPQRYHAYFLHDWMQRRRLANGLMYSSLYTRVELDCRELLTRPLRVVPLYGGRATPPIDIPDRERRWTRPRPDSPDDVALRSACGALGRQP
jgi:hypothetical protein